MVNLEQIAQTGMISVDAAGVMHPEMISLGEQLMAEEFAEVINSGRLSVNDAFLNFWGYEEDPKIWNLTENREWHAIMPSWRFQIAGIASYLKRNKLDEFISAISENYCVAANNLPLRSAVPLYNPFFDDFCLAAYLETINKGAGEYISCSNMMKTALTSHFDHENREAGRVLMRIGDEESIGFILNRLDHRLSKTVGAELMCYGGEETIAIAKKYCEKMGSPKELADYIHWWELNHLGNGTHPEELRYQIVSKKNNDESAPLHALQGGRDKIKYYELYKQAKEGDPKAITKLKGDISNSDYPMHWQAAIDILSTVRTLDTLQFFIERLRKRETWQRTRLEFMSEKRQYEDIYRAIHTVHQHLKPQGYTPEQKRLAA